MRSDASEQVSSIIFAINLTDSLILDHLARSLLDIVLTGQVMRGRWINLVSGAQELV